MSNKTYHGDPDRSHHFWVYPKNKPLVNSLWDTHHASDLCDNHTLIETDSHGTKKYRCNGHGNAWHGGAGGQHSNTNNTHHGDPSRGHHFWVYPRDKPLVDSRWDAHHASDLCDNHTLIETDSHGTKKYRCNGHDNAWHGGAGGQYSNTSNSNRTYHGDPSRGHHFWVYPKNKPLVNSSWDAHHASDLCDNHTLLDTDSNGIKKYRCNGHAKGQDSDDCDD